MTLAGTRPPTLDEWNKYELHHRARLDACMHMSETRELGEYWEELMESRLLSRKKPHHPKLLLEYAAELRSGYYIKYKDITEGGFTDGLLQAQERGEVRLITLEDLYK